MLLDVEAGAAEDSLSAEEVNRSLALYFLRNYPVLALFALFSNHFRLHKHLMDRLGIQVVHIFHDLERLLIERRCRASEVNYAFRLVQLL